MYYRSTPKFTAQAFDGAIAPSHLETNQAAQKKLFKTFLVVSVLIHLFALFYHNRKSIHLNASPLSDAPLSLKINIRKPVMQPKVQPIKKVVKKNPFKKKEAVKELEKEIPKKVAEEEPMAATPQSTTRNFDSVIANYIQPRYPRMAIRRGLTGIVTLTLWIMNNGNVAKVELTKSSGHTALDKSALNAVKQWKFKNLVSVEDSVYKVEKRIVYKIN